MASDPLSISRVLLIINGRVCRIDTIAKLHPQFVYKSEWFICDPMAVGFPGFVDWIRNIDKEIIGVRLQLLDGCLSKDDYELISQHAIGASLDVLHMYFRLGQKEDSDSSSDQLFGSTFIFAGSLGSVAITFPIDDISRDDVAGLRQLCREC